MEKYFAIPEESTWQLLARRSFEFSWHQLSGSKNWMNLNNMEFLYCRLVALGNLLEKVGDFYMELWNTAVNAVKAAVEVIKKVVDAVVEWAKNFIKEFFSKVLKPVINSFVELGHKLKEDISKALSGALNPANLAKILVGIIVGSAVFIGLMTIIGALSIINTVTNIVTGGGAAVLSQLGGGIAKLLIGFFVTMAAAELVGITVDECLKQAEDATKGTFELADFIKWFGFYLASKTRILKSVQKVAPVGLGVALLGIVIFAAKKMVVTGKTKFDYATSLGLDTLSIITLVYAKTKFKNYPWVARWYKLMDIAQDVLEVVGIAGVATEMIEDIHGFITAG